MKKAVQIILFGLLFITSCDHFEDLNTPSDAILKATPEELLPGIIRSAVNATVKDAFLTGNHAAQLTARNFGVEIDIYNWTGISTTWFNLYNILRDVKDLKQKAKSNNQPNYQAIALILESWLFSILTDAYGDIPYSQGGNGVITRDFTPKYDTQETIYKGTNGLLAILERANNFIDLNQDPIQNDILFDNDLLKWKKLCNSLRIRLLLRISGKESVATRMTNIVENQPIITSLEDQAVLKYLDEFPNDYPILQLKSGVFDAARIGENAVQTFKTYDDPRLGVYARPTDASINTNTPEYLGWINGAIGCDTDGSKLGLTYHDFPNHPTSSNKADGIIMTHAEVAFIIAEVIQRGWLTTGNAGEYYKAGIQSSMDYYDVDYEDFDWIDFEDFYANSGVQYNNTLLQITEQKWLALFFTGLEPYFEIRRRMAEENYDWTIFPFLTPPCNNINNDQFPLRFLYPNEEILLNSRNYEEAVNRLGGNTINHKMWLLQ